MRYLTLLLLAFAFPGLAAAHGDGTSFETTVDGYAVDIGYSSPVPQAGEFVSFDFALQHEASGKDVDFDDVWVKITNEEGTVVFASGIYNAPFGGARMSYTFPSEGRYTVSARFEGTDGSITEVEFPFSVSSAENNDTPFQNTLLIFALGAVLGATIVFFLRKKLS